MALSHPPRSLKILAIHRYFWPDTPPYAVMLREIAGRWVRDGHDVSILSTQPSYKVGVCITKQPEHEVLDGIKLHRMSLPSKQGQRGTNVLNALLFSVRAFLQVLTSKADVVMISTAPPIIGASLVCLASYLIGARFIYHCMDIHPEIGQISGEFRNPIIFKALRAVDSWTCRHAALVIVLSEDMAKALKDRPGCKAIRIEVINNFSLPEFDTASDKTPPANLSKQEGVFRVLFAGNLGRFQGLEMFVDAFHLLKTRTDIELVFLGDGRAAAALKARANGMKNIRFIPHQPISIAKSLIASSDLGIVSLIYGVSRYAYPSKTMTYLEQGLPVLIAVESGSSVAQLVERQGLGLRVDPGDAEGTAKLLGSILNDRTNWANMKHNACTHGATIFDKESTLNQWAGLL